VLTCGLHPLRIGRFTGARVRLGHLAPTGHARLPHVRRNQRLPRLPAVRDQPPTRIGIVRPRGGTPRVPGCDPLRREHLGRELVNPSGGVGESLLPVNLSRHPAAEVDEFLEGERGQVKVVRHHWPPRMNGPNMASGIVLPCCQVWEPPGVRMETTPAGLMIAWNTWPSLFITVV